MKKSKRLTALFIAVVMGLMLVLTGCGQQQENQSNSSEGKAITITDLDGKTHTFEKPIDKAIIHWSGGGGPFFTIAALWGDEVADHIANMDQTMPVNRYDMWEQFTKDIPKLKELPHFGDYDDGTFDVEAAIQSGADCAILPSVGLKETVKEQYQEKLEAAGIPVIYIDYHSEILDYHIQSIEIIGKLYGKEERAKELIDWYKAKHENITSRVDNLLKTKERPTVHIEVTSKGPSANVAGFSTKYMWGRLVYLAGGMPTGEGLVEKSGEINPEVVITKDPQTIILCGAYWPKTADAIQLGYMTTPDKTRELLNNFIEKRAGWSELTAVKKGEVYTASHILPRDVWDVVSLESCAKSIWPEEFADLDPHKTLEEFFEKFMPFEYGGTWYLKL